MRIDVASCLLINIVGQSVFFLLAYSVPHGRVAERGVWFSAQVFDRGKIYVRTTRFFVRSLLPAWSARLLD